MTGYAGQKGTADLAAAKKEMLRKSLPDPLLEAAQVMAADYEPPESCLPAARVKIAAGGVSGALWLLGEKLQTGLTADLRAVPIRQETVEICEELDLDPYLLRGDGAWLMAVEDAEEALIQCRMHSVPAAKIGETSPGMARVLACGDVTRYLERA